MEENKYICQSCFHKGMCLEYDDECYGCTHYANTADVAPREEVERWRDMYYRANAERMELKNNYVPAGAVENARRDVAREIIDEMRRTIDANAKVGLSSALILAAINNELVFLEQKYTEDQK